LAGRLSETFSRKKVSNTSKSVQGGTG
jgi:hypothetical protein